MCLSPEQTETDKSWRVIAHYIFQYENKGTFHSVNTTYISNNFRSVYYTSYMGLLFTKFCILIRFSVMMASVKGPNL